MRVCILSRAWPPHEKHVSCFFINSASENLSFSLLLRVCILSRPWPPHEKHVSCFFHQFSQRESIILFTFESIPTFADKRFWLLSSALQITSSQLMTDNIRTITTIFFFNYHFDQANILFNCFFSKNYYNKFLLTYLHLNLKRIGFPNTGIPPSAYRYFYQIFF